MHLCDHKQYMVTIHTFYESLAYEAAVNNCMLAWRWQMTLIMH